MKHIIATRLGKVEILPIFNDEFKTAYKCYLIGANVIVRVRDLHRLEEKWRSLILPCLEHGSASQNMVLRRYIFSISFVPLHHEA